MKNRFDKYFNAREDLFNNRLFFIKSVASVCTNLDENSTFWPQSANRFAPLGMDENAGTNHKYYFAIMLGNSANHLPTVIDNLLRVIYHLGEMNVFMSIHEGGSSDEGHTTAMIETIRITLEAIGIEHAIVTGDVSTDARNKVMEPLRAMHKSSGRIFNTVVMMSDDLWCAEEFLELLFQSRGQAATVTCSTDVRTSDDDEYSISPGHDINGRLFRKVAFHLNNAKGQGRVSGYIQDEYTATRFRDNHPLRVQACSSSLLILDPTPLYPPFSFQFTAPNIHPSDSFPQPWENRCGFPSALDMAVRYAAAGFNRAMLVPRSQTAGTLLDFFKLHRTFTERAEREQLHRQLGLWVPEDTGGRDNPFARDYEHEENDIMWMISPRLADRCTSS